MKKIRFFLISVLVTAGFCETTVKDSEKLNQTDETTSYYEVVISSETYGNNKYVNWGIGFEITKPEKWAFTPLKAVKRLRRSNKKKLKKKDEREPSETWIKLLTINEYPYGKPVDYNSKVYVSVLNRESRPGIETAYDAAKSNQILKKRKSRKKTYKKMSKIHQIQVNGYSCAYFEYCHRKKHREEKKDFGCINAYFIHNRQEIALRCKTLKKNFKNLQDDFLNIINSVKFHK